MKIYYPVPNSDEYDRFFCTNKKDDEAIGQIKFLDRSISSWEPITVDIDSAGKSGDFPAIAGHQIVLSQKALNILKPILGKSVQELALVCASGSYFLINVIDIVDCLDYSRSKVDRFTSDGRLMRIKSYAFIDGCIGDRNIFKLPEICNVLVSQTFKDTVEKNGLEGLIFRQVV